MPTPSLLIVPARFKSGKLYSQIPTSGAGDFTVNRATAATRMNASGFIESVASGIPRLDYFASGGTVGCPALLVEPSAANGILNSTDTTTSWTLGANLTRGAIDVIGVLGTNLTVAVSGSGINLAAGRIARSGNNVALASGSTYTISFFVKKTGTHTIGGYYALITGAASGNLGAGFDVSGSFSSGSIFDTAGTTNRIRRVEQWGTDVFCCSETFTMTASGTLTSFFLAPVAGVTSSSNPTAGSQLGFAAPQIELGSVPTSFIPTTTASVTRNAEEFAVSGAVSGSIGQQSGTIYIECQSGFATNDIIVINTAGQSPGNNYVAITKTATNVFRLSLIASGTTILIDQASAITSFAKIAVAYASGNTALFINGTQIGSTDTTGFSFNAALNNITFISNMVSGTKTTRIRAVALYTERLTNDQLASLTTP
jgi:hypothetical protein